MYVFHTCVKAAAVRACSGARLPRMGEPRARGWRDESVPTKCRQTAACDRGVGRGLPRSVGKHLIGPGCGSPSATKADPQPPRTAPGVVLTANTQRQTTRAHSSERDPLLGGSVGSERWRRVRVV